MISNLPFIHRKNGITPTPKPGSLICPVRFIICRQTAEKNYIIVTNIHLIFPSHYDIIIFAEKNSIRVWRSLVARLNGVQEAAGSTPVTRTQPLETCSFKRFFFSFPEKSPSPIKTPPAKRAFTHSPAGVSIYINIRFTYSRSPSRLSPSAPLPLSAALLSTSGSCRGS